jgi:hypothetical protein
MFFIFLYRYQAGSCKCHESALDSQAAYVVTYRPWRLSTVATSRLTATLRDCVTLDLLNDIEA